MKRYERKFSEGENAIHMVLTDGFDIDKKVADVYASKIYKSKKEKEIKSILSDIIKDDKDIKKALNMIMDEL